MIGDGTCVCVCATMGAFHFDTHTKLSKASTSGLGPRNTRLRSIEKATPTVEERSARALER